MLLKKPLYSCWCHVIIMFIVHEIIVLYLNCIICRQLSPLCVKLPSTGFDTPIYMSRIIIKHWKHFPQICLPFRTRLLQDFVSYLHGEKTLFISPPTSSHSLRIATAGIFKTCGNFYRKVFVIKRLLECTNSRQGRVKHFLCKICICIVSYSPILTWLTEI